MKPAPQRLTIRRHLQLLTLWACLPMAAFCGWQIIRTYQDNLAHLREQVRFWRDAAAEQLENYFAETQRSLAHLALVADDPAAFAQAATQMFADSPAHHSLTRLDAAGHMLSSTDPDLTAGAVPPWFKPAAGTNEFEVGGMFRAPLGGWLVPMYQRGPTGITLALLTRPQLQLEQALGRTWPRTGVVVMALEDGGNVALHSQRPGYYLGTNFPEYATFRGRLAAGALEGEAPGFDQDPRIYAAAKIANSPWIMRASVRKTDAQAAMRRSIRLSLGLLGFSLLTALVAANRLASRISGPTVALADAARRSTAGDETIPLTETGPAEVADTARAFNEMVVQRRQNLAQLEASESRYRQLFEHMPASFVLCEVVRGPAGKGVDFRFLEVNPAFERLTQRPANSLVGRLVSEAIPDLEPDWIEHCRDAAVKGEATSFERHSRAMNRHLDVFGFQPRPGQFALVFTDVTERTLSRQQLDLANRRYSGLVNSIGGIVWDAAPDGPFTFVSPQAERILGYPVTQWLTEAHFWENHLHPEDRAWVPGHSQAEAEAGRDHVLDYRMVHADGRVVWLRDLVTVLSAGTNPGRVIGVMFDITEQKRSEIALRESERRLELALEGGDLGLWDWDMATNSVRYSDRWVTMLGYDPATFDGTLAAWERLVHPDDFQPTQAAIRACFIEERSPFYESVHRLKSASGHWVWVMARGRIVERDATGRPRRAAGTHLDITAARVAADENDALEKKIQETQKLESLGVLAGGIAHDFNNLLTGILGNASLARLEMPPGSPGLDSLAEVEKAAERAANLCKQMLAYSGRGRFVVQRLNVNQVIEDTTHLLSISIGKGVVLRFNLAAGLPAIEVDVTQIRQVIMNLVINASEAIGPRSGVIAISSGVVRADAAYLNTVAYTPAPVPGDYVWVEVSDNGCGMSPATLAKIFDSFFTTKFTGRGLGLAAVLGIVRGHRGAIKVYSEPDKGTTFKLLFPVVEGPATPLETRVVPPVSWHAQGHLLVIDDDETIRTLSVRMLNRIGFTTEMFGDPREAIESFARDPRRFDLVLLDLTMPHLGGEETFRRLRAVRSDLRIVLMSGFTEEDVVSRFSGKGLAGFVQKPFDSANLITELRRVLEASPDAT
jgi:PAS domain S-box-containing protein